MSVGFVITHKRKWKTFGENPSSWGGFYSFTLQHYLFPYFKVEDIEIDPYDGADFTGDTLPLLIERLKESLIYMAEKDTSWPLNPTEMERYYSESESYKLDLLPPKEQSIQILERALYLAQLAHKRSESLIFVGD